MGLFDDFFGTSTPEPSGGFFDGLFGGGSSSQEDSSPSLFGSYSEPIMPLGGHAKGYGDQPFSSFSEAGKSGLMDGIVKDPDTGYVGTPAQIYGRYLTEGRDPSGLIRRFHK